MLWWLLLLAIPIIVHLFNFRKYKTIIFSNIQFLQKVENQTKKIKELKKYLILASRMGFFSFLIMAFTIPYCGKKKAQGLPKHVVIYLDNTYSMSKSLEKAKNNARSLIDLLNSKDKITLITAGLNPETFSAKSDAIKKIDELQCVASSPIFSSLNQTISELNNKDMGEVSIFVISDFQKGFIDFGNIKLPLNNYYFNPIPNSVTTNLAIDSAYLSDLLGNDKNSVTLNIVLKNNGLQDLTDIPIISYIGGKAMGTITLSIGANQTKETSIAISRKADEDLEGYLVIESKDFDFDNTLYFYQKNSQAKKKILYLGETNKYIETVLKTETNFEIIKASKLPNDVTIFSGIIINGYVQGIDNNGLLKNFVIEGGNILLIPSEQGIQADFSNLGVSKWSNLITESQQISKIDFNHPLYTNVYKSVPNNPISPMVSKYFSISTQGTGKSILSNSNESPIFIDFVQGRGHVYQSAIAISTTWSEFPLVGYLFYPTIAKSMYSNSSNLPIFSWLHDEKNNGAIIISEIKKTSEERYQLLLKNKSFTTEISNNGDNTFLYPAKEMQDAGVYSIISGEVATKKLLGKIALNIDRKESNPSYATIDQMQQYTAITQSTLVINNMQNLPVIAQNRGIINTSWKWFIVFALVFILIEIFLLRYLK